MKLLCILILSGLGILFLDPSSIAAQEKSALVWQSDFAASLQEAKEQKKPMLVDFYATWCGPCRRLDEEVFPDPEVAARLAKFILVKVDVDQDTETAFAWQIASMPRSIIFNIYGQPISDRIGFMEAADYAAMLDDALARAEEKIAEVPKPSADEVDTILQSPEATPPKAKQQSLLQLLGSADPNLRWEAAERMARYPTRALPILLAALHDDYLGTRIAARALLLKLGAPVESFDPWAAKSDRAAALAKLSHSETGTAVD